MPFLEPIIAALFGSAVTALALFLKKNGVAVAVLKHGALLKRAYDIVDPILDKNIGKWNGSQVDKTFELAVEAVGDGSLSESEIKELATHMAKEWLPAAAVEKVRALGVSFEDEKVSEITKKVEEG